MTPPTGDLREAAREIASRYAAECGWSPTLAEVMAEEVLALASPPPPPEGPWAARKSNVGNWWVEDTMQMYDGDVHGPFTESQATGVRDALNQDAARALNQEGEKDA